MDWLYALDVAVFRFINRTLANPAFDWALPWFSWNSFFIPAVILFGVLLAWRGGRRGRICLFVLLVAVAVGDSLVCNSIKHAIERPRPFTVLEDVRLLVGKGSSASMPSAHMANWAAGTMIAFLYFRRIAGVIFAIAVLIGFTRVYLGVHYPSDVLVGAVVGAGSAAGVVFVLDGLWRWFGQRWLPLWWARMPSLLNPDARLPDAGVAANDEKSADATSRADAAGGAFDRQLLVLGYVLIAVLLVGRIGYLAAGKIELSEDEAYQWVWSKHLDLSYYSKPPMIAYAQFIGTSLWGDTELGVRFLSPIIAALLSFMMLRFFAREGNVRAGFALVIVLTATPLLAVGATLMTIDPLSVLFWTAAMISGWRAVQLDSTRHWLLTGLWMGLGFLSKYVAVVQLLCWAVFFVLWKPARAQLRRPGPWLAIVVLLVCTIPVLIWNARHDWITVTHLSERGGLDTKWVFKSKFVLDFILVEFGLLNPVFFVAMIWAGIAFWRRDRGNPLLLYFFSMGAPLFLFYALYTIRARVQPNWIAPSILPLFCLMIVHWEKRWREGSRVVARWLWIGTVPVLVGIVLLHDTNLVGKIAGRPLPGNRDPLVRVRGWKAMATLVGEEREKLLAEGKAVFIIGGHYGVTGLISFYLPEAQAGIPDNPLAYFISADVPLNQFFFWPGYQERKGQNAIFVQRVRDPMQPPERLLKEFTSVADLGAREVLYRGRVFHRVQLFACRGLK